GLRASGGSVVGRRCPAGMESSSQERHGSKKILDGVGTADIIGLMRIRGRLSPIDTRRMNGQQPHGVQPKRFQVSQAKAWGASCWRAADKVGEGAALSGYPTDCI